MLSGYPIYATQDGGFSLIKRFFGYAISSIKSQQESLPRESNCLLKVTSRAIFVVKCVRKEKYKGIITKICNTGNHLGIKRRRYH